MKRVLTFGVFDFFHYGHLKVLERSRMLGDYLIVAVQADEEIHVRKPNASVFYSTQQRVEMLQALRCVDEIVVYQQVWDDITKINFDILAVGGDQTHDGFQKAIQWCIQNGKEIVTLSRTPKISSTIIKSNLGIL